MTFSRAARSIVITILAVTFVASAVPAEVPATQPASVFDPTRHMRVSEVKPGMTGYGLSVFRGTTIERFDLEVISVLKNFNPKYDVVLIRCKGAYLEHTGAIAGMSGSPIYLRDDQGRDRMIGAFAYGWPLMKDPIAGVQPIEYMLDIPPTQYHPPAPTTKPAAASADATSAPLRWNLLDVIVLPGQATAPATFPFAGFGTMQPNPRLSSDADDTTRLKPLATPLMAGGLSPRLLEQFAPIFKASGLVPLQAGGVSGLSPVDQPAADLAPGSVLAVPLLTGDADLTAVGTCTEVLGDRVFGFGHAFNNEGAIALPMGSGQINGVIANLMTSFKLGSLTKTRGTLGADQTVGIAGKLGEAPAMIPIDLRVTYADGSLDQHYHFNAAVHPRFTPLLCAVAIGSTISGVKELPQYNTLDYNLTVEFANGQKINVVNTAVNASASDIFYEIGSPMIAAAENPFERVLVKNVSGTMHVKSEARQAQILFANVPRLKYQPGETVRAYVTYRPFHAGEAVMPVELELPRDLPDGTYQLVISDWQKYLEDQRTAEPFRFTAESTDQVFDLLRDLTGVRRNALYLRLMRQADGIAIGRTAMPRLPSSHRQVLVGAGRSNTLPFVSSTIKTMPTELVMNGSAQFAITIDKNLKVEIGGPKAAKHETPAKAEKTEESKPKPAKSDTPAQQEQTPGE